jgi:hypothetical protein
MNRPLSALLLLSIIELLFSSPAWSQQDFVYTNDDVFQRNTVSAFSVSWRFSANSPFAAHRRRKSFHASVPLSVASNQ